MSFWGGSKKSKREDEPSAIPTTTSGATVTANTTTPESAQFLRGDLLRSEAGSSYDNRAGHQDLRARAVVAAPVSLHGAFSYDDSLRVDGRVTGDLYSRGTLHVSKSGVVEASVAAATLIVEGVVRGAVQASRVVEIRAGGVIDGVVSAPNLVVHEGGVLVGDGYVPTTVYRFDFCNR
jgi:cytoskeletal protein CcmA (bactofilin family)